MKDPLAIRERPLKELRADLSDPELVQILDDTVASVNTVDDIFYFFNSKFKELKNLWQDNK